MNETDKKFLKLSQREFINAYFDGMKETVDFVQNKVTPVLKGQVDLNSSEVAIAGIFYRVHALGSSLSRLNHVLDFNASAIIRRTLYELLLDLKLLYSDDATKKYVEKFHAFPGINRFRTAQKISEFQHKNPGVETHAFFSGDARKKLLTTPGNSTKVETQVQTLWGRNKRGKLKWPNHWSGLSIRERAEKFGIIYEQEYLEIYGLLSSYTHAGSARLSRILPRYSRRNLWAFT